MNKRNGRLTIYNFFPFLQTAYKYTKSKVEIRLKSALFKISLWLLTDVLLEFKMHLRQNAQCSSALKISIFIRD